MSDTVTTQSEHETSAIGKKLASTLSTGDVVLLYGDLGAGKTAFTKGLAEGLGAARDDVSSPTFTIMQEYRGGRLPLYHVDLYRLNDPREIEDLGLEELASDGVLAIEWAEKLPARLKLALGLADAVSRNIAVHITHGDADTRTIQIGSSALP